MKKIPDIPTTVMAEHTASIAVIDATADGARASSRCLHPSVRERWNDYGIGLLLQGDLKGAEAAFEKVAAMDPKYADGWVNIGRARLQEGNLAGAEDVLRRALAIDPKLAKTHFFLGVMLKNDGRYDEALRHLRTASDLYPRDRVVLNQLGRVLFLKRQFSEAIEQFNKVLRIDPEDLQAHYNLMLCYQGLGDHARAARERTLYERFKADEASQAITGPYRQLHPHDNNERQSIHEHGSASPGGILMLGASQSWLAASRAVPSCRSPPRAQTAPPTAGASSADVYRCHLGRGHTVPPQQRCIRQKISARNDGRGRRVLRRRRRRMAGRAADQFQKLAGPPGDGRRRSTRCIATIGTVSFTDVTARSGLGVSMYGIGAAAADYDNDGAQDVYITGLDGNRLFRGIGGGRFEDVTARAGVGASGFSTCAVWFDYDNDGRLDLFVCRYVEWSIKTDLFCTLDGTDQVVLHAGILQGTESAVVPQQRQRRVRGRDEGGRSLRSGIKSARRGADRSR